MAKIGGFCQTLKEIIAKGKNTCLAFNCQALKQLRRKTTFVSGAAYSLKTIYNCPTFSFSYEYG